MTNVFRGLWTWYVIICWWGWKAWRKVRQWRSPRTTHMELLDAPLRQIFQMDLSEPARPADFGGASRIDETKGQEE